MMEKAKEIRCVLCGYPNPVTADKCRGCGRFIENYQTDASDLMDAEHADDQTLVAFKTHIGPTKRYRLVMIDEDDQAIETFEITDGCVVGRTAGDIQLLDRHVSRRHCRFSIQKGRLYIEDTNSTNGVFVRIRKAAQIQTPAELLIGRTICRVFPKS
ncbi:MAG: FHA domain-containing protein [Gammaproteobacteria bacterium]